jgi:hypothetical protein
MGARYGAIHLLPPERITGNLSGFLEPALESRGW